ncbi:hypothetical protein L1987_18648 [Smallanthus sonchifolius]|uniref:Uncharacterized protein n=1 Tax=Smallanthus sonchifolius TaxID=185202 RepID=A0ACB9J1V0_9ASTR|nr:hypothetical protein L1987_18648 [Smallanthus sonchifolius]
MKDNWFLLLSLVVEGFVHFCVFESIFFVSTLSWPPPFYFWPLFFIAQFLSCRSIDSSQISSNVNCDRKGNYSAAICCCRVA